MIMPQLSKMSAERALSVPKQIASAALHIPSPPTTSIGVGAGAFMIGMVVAGGIAFQNPNIHPAVFGAGIVSIPVMARLFGVTAAITWTAGAVLGAAAVTAATAD